MKEKGEEKDYYTTLGAGREATRAEIERLYKRLAQKFHPDRGGDEERMKALNEAWRVLGDAEARRAYDERRASRRRPATYQAYAPASTHGAQADAVYGRVAGAVMCLLAGLVLVFLVRVHYVRFLWPLALLGIGVVLFGVLMAHGALSFARERVAPTHPARRFVWAQELAFWSCVAGGVYVVYLAMTAV